MNTELETRKHQQQVQEYLLQMIHELAKRASSHDKSKLESPEYEVFSKYTQLLKGTTYGSEEYDKYLEEMKPALDHHYANNSHHPEHYNGHGGINGMDLIDLLEMFVDWKSATLRHADGNMKKSIEHNQKRFSIGDQLTKIFKNTMKYFE
jgi:ClpP class serine protease